MCQNMAVHPGRHQRGLIQSWQDLNVKFLFLCVCVCILYTEGLCLLLIDVVQPLVNSERNFLDVPTVPDGP